MSQRVRLGELLVEARIITREQLDEVLRRQATDPRRLGILLVEAGLLTETEVTQILSQQLSVPWVSLYHIDFSRQLLNLVPEQLAERYCVVPIFVRRVRGLGQTLYIAMDDPSDEAAIAAVAEYSGLPVRTMIAPPSEIRAAIRAYYTSGSLRPVQAPASEQRSVGTAAEQALPPTVRASLPAKTASGDAAARDAANAALAQASQTDEPSTDQTGPTPVVPAPPSKDAPVTDAAAIALATPGAGRAPSVGESSAVNSRRAGMPEPRRGAAHRMITVTLLDGTEIKLPARSSSANGEGSMPGEQLTARDMVVALRAAVHGADASQILGDNPRWERLVAALLAVLLRKHLIADWEFVDEYNKLGND